jgi:acetolactate synthase-1/2/3 large subunit
MEHTGADILLRTLENYGVEYIFGYPGANSLPIHDSLLKSSIHHYLMRHEQAAAHAADGYARATGKVGVCLATSGPGATNLVTGIATAFMDSTPLIALTGQVTSNLLGSDAFQETDIIGITMPITKHSFLIHDVKDLQATVEEALEIAQSGRPGPVLIDLPRDVVAARGTFDRKETASKRVWKKAEQMMGRDDMKRISRIVDSLNKSERPVILVGGGIKLAGACTELTALVEKGHTPFVTTMMGVGSIASGNGYDLGFIGTHGCDLANRIVHQSDFILALGTRFSDRTTSKVEEFAPLASLAQIDVDATSVGKIIKPDISLISDLREALNALLPLVEEKKRKDWLVRIDRERNSIKDRGNGDGCGPAGDCIKMVQEFMPENTIAVTDVGLNQIWTVRNWRTRTPRGLITSGGMGTMGFSVPAAIGAQIAAPKQHVIVFSGDGGFFMNMQELATISTYNIPVKIVVFNNGNLGMIRQIQHLFYDSRFADSELGNGVDITAVAKGFGIPSARTDAENPEAGIKKMCAAKGPFLLEVMVDPDTYVFPIIPPGRSNMEMIYGRSD